MVLHVKEKFWNVTEITEIVGADFATAISFVELHSNETYIFPAVSSQNEIWQVGEMEFVLLSGHEMFHIGLFPDRGIETFFRRPAEFCKPLFENSYIYFENAMGTSHLYSVLEQSEISMVLENLIDPSISVTIEKSAGEKPMRISIKAPQLTGVFLLRKPPLEPGFYSCTVSSVRTFEQFVKLAKERCKEARVAEYYEKCGGYSIDGGMVRGIFTQKIYGNSVAYEFSPDDFFNRVAIPKLLLANGLIEVGPNKPCVFLGQTIDNPKYTIGLSHDALMIVEHTEKGDKAYALEMYGQACLGLRQVGEDSFLAITSCPTDEPPMWSAAQLRHFVPQEPAGNFVWDDFTISIDGKSYVSTTFCQLTDDIILFERDPKTHNNHHFDMWSISQDRLVNLADTFCNICCSKHNWDVAHTEKQILVKRIGKKYIDKEREILLAIRLYRPKEYCDVFALLDPSAKFRVFGKVYNMLTDSITAKPRVFNDLIKMLDQNEDTKAIISEHLSGTLDTPS